MTKYKTNIDTRCSVCHVHAETVFPLFWSSFYTEQLGKNIGTFIYIYKDIVFGYFDFDLTKYKACFVVNLIYFLGKFTNNKPI